MAKEFLNIVEAIAFIDQGRGEGMSQIMHSEVLKPHSTAGGMPRLIDAGERLARVGVWEHPRTPV